MLGSHKIDYNAVSGKVAELKSIISLESSSLEQEYVQALSLLSSLDGAADASFKEAMDRNKYKALVTAEILSKLLDFVDEAAKEYKRLDDILASLFLLPPVNAASPAPPTPMPQGIAPQMS